MVPSDQLIDVINLLLEQDWQRSYKKPFPHRADLFKGSSGGAIPGRLQSEGKPWKALIYAEDAPIPEEMFTVMDLHSQRKSLPGFIGWIGGSYTKGRTTRDPESGEEKKRWPMMWVDEAQSDLLQRTFDFQDPEAYKKMLQKELYTSSAEFRDLYDELGALRTEFEGSRAYMPLKRQLEIQQRLEDLPKEIADVTARWEKKVKYPQYSKFKTKLENYYKRWIDAFFNVALEFAKEEEIALLLVISAENIRSVWHANGGVETINLFNRVYDDTANRWGMQKMKDKTSGKEWWWARVSELSPIARKK